MTEYKCEFKGCETICGSPSALVNHNRIHSKENLFKCDYKDCGKEFTFKCALVNHKRTHTGEKPYLCEYKGCNKAFAVQHALKTHERIHTGERPYKCEYKDCGKTFTQSSSLKEHIKVHTNFRPFKCDYEGCDKTFKRSHHLEQHKYIHSNKRPFKCKYKNCNKSFRSKSNLKSHSYIHSGIKKYKCKNCNKKFRYKFNLKRHNYLHQGLRPHKCQINTCKEAFACLSNLKRHQISWHTKKGQARRKRKEHRCYNELKKRDIVLDREVQIDFKMYDEGKKKDCFDSGKHFARIDFVVYKEDYAFLIEHDEAQHKYGEYYSISCDIARMSHIITALRILNDNRKIVFVRFNCDSFKIDDVSQNRILMKDRYDSLANLIKKYKPKDDLEIFYMYYDITNGKPDIIHSKDYNKYMAKCVKIWENV